MLLYLRNGTKTRLSTMVSRVIEIVICSGANPSGALVWFQHYRRECFYDQSQASKWSKRESKQNWRVTLFRAWRDRSRPGSGMATPSESASGTLTPREIREERWRVEKSGEAKIDKSAMREMYKELGGRKARSKNVATGPRDRGGWEQGDGGW